MAKIYANIREIMAFRQCPRKLALKLMGVKVRRIEHREMKQSPTEIGKQGEDIVNVAMRHIISGEPIKQIIGRIGVSVTPEFRSILEDLLHIVAPLLEGYRRVEKGVIKSSLTQTVHRPDFILLDSDEKITIVEVKNTKERSRNHLFQARFYLDINNMCGSSIANFELLLARRVILIYPRLRQVITQIGEEYSVGVGDIRGVLGVKRIVNMGGIPEEKGNCTRCQYRKVCAKFSSQMKHISLGDISIFPPELLICRDIARRYGSTVLDELFEAERKYRVFKEKPKVELDTYEIGKILEEYFSEWKIDLKKEIIARRMSPIEVLIKECSPHFYPKRSVFFVDKAFDLLKRKEEKKAVTLMDFM